jgi:hypothetical protein
MKILSPTFCGQNNLLLLYILKKGFSKTKKIRLYNILNIITININIYTLYLYYKAIILFYFQYIDIIDLFIFFDKIVVL